MATFGDLSAHDGNFKIKYARKFMSLLPAFSILQDDIDFSQEDKVGLRYEQAVQVRRAHSFTYKASTDSLGTLQEVNASDIDRAQLDPSIIIGRNGANYTSLFRGTAGAQSFTSEMDLLVEDLWEAGRHRLEVDLLYGANSGGLGIVSGAPAANVVTLTTASFAPGIWTGMEGAHIEVFDSVLTTQRTGTGSDTVGSGYYTITAVDLDNNTITVDDDQNIADTDRVFFRTQRTTSAHKTMIGLDSILTASSSIFNINPASFNLWKGNAVAAGSTEFSFDLVLEGTGKAVVKGQLGPMNCYCTPTAWNNAMSDLSALRRLAKSDQVQRVVLGAENITFYTQTGKTEVKAHPMVKNGSAYGIPTDQYKRVGSTDFTFDNPLGASAHTKSIFFDVVPNSDGVEIRSFSDQALFPGKLGRGYVITGIVNS